MSVYLSGLVLGLSLIMALGPQNVFLLRQGALRKHAVLSAVICFVCDLILMYASVAGLQKVIALHPTFQAVITWFGVAFLLFYGINTFRQALRKQKKSIQAHKSPNRWQIVGLALGFSLLNPHAIIDSLVIIGSGSSQFPEHPQAFLLGVISASFLWFTSITFTSHYFSNVLSKARVWQRIEFSSGTLMVFLGLKLANSLI
ncbi:MAG: LysE family transporter [Tatlockia sp.]|jgi:L-lysine exporter family protein LysE/ArgO